MAHSRGQIHVDFLKSIAARGGKIINARFSLQRGLLKFVEPVYWLTLEQQGVRSLEECSWSSELESYLLFDARLRTDTEEDEVQRFAAILLNNLRTAEAEHGGKDFVHAVLVEVLHLRPEYALQPLLKRVATAKPSTSSTHHTACVSFLLHSIDGLRNTAIASLGYSAEEATARMRTALQIVLEEIFHLSAIEQLFPGRR